MATKLNTFNSYLLLESDPYYLDPKLPLLVKFLKKIRSKKVLSLCINYLIEAITQ